MKTAIVFLFSLLSGLVWGQSLNTNPNALDQKINTALINDVKSEKEMVKTETSPVYDLSTGKRKAKKVRRIKWENSKNGLYQIKPVKDLKWRLEDSSPEIEL